MSTILPHATEYALPGALRIHPDAESPNITALAYSPDAFEERDISDLSALDDLRREWPVVWVDVEHFGDESILLDLGKRFGLHRLAIADIVSLEQRPKMEEYSEKLFVILREICSFQARRTEQLSLFVGKGFVLTFHDHTSPILQAVRARIQRGLGRIRNAEADYLLYSLIDAVVDGYWPVLEECGERLEALENAIGADSQTFSLKDIRVMKRTLLAIRRSVWPLRDVIQSLQRGDSDLIRPETTLYLRDAHDHIARTMDLLEVYREMASDLLGMQMATVSNRMNAVMKVLTVIATIFIPLTFIAGIYGMNFKQMPELDMPWGYAGSLSLMAAVALAMLLYFRRKGWI